MSSRKTPADKGTSPEAGLDQTADVTPTFEEREAALAAREAELDSREMALAPREREATISTRSRATDDSRRNERQDMDYYAPSNQLEVPYDPEYHYRWIAESVNGQETPRNVQQRLRDGYVRVMMDDLPEDFLVDEDKKGDGYARTTGLILMRAPLRKKELRDNYYRKKSIERANSVDDLQGVAGKNAVREDRGSRTLTGAEAGRALANMSQS